MLTSKEKSDTKRLPMMPIRDVVIFPYMMTPFVVGRESSVRALEEAMAGDKKIFLATQHDASIDEPKPNEIYNVGTIVNIVQSLKLPDGNIKVLVEGVERAKVISVSDEDGFFRAIVRTWLLDMTGDRLQIGVEFARRITAATQLVRQLLLDLLTLRCLGQRQGHVDLPSFHQFEQLGPGIDAARLEAHGQSLRQLAQIVVAEPLRLLAAVELEGGPISG